MKQEGSLSVRDVVAIVVGIVIGVGIFRTPSLVAANAGGPGLLILIWILGGVISLNGSLCYAELATTYPHPGGDYHYMTRAFGKKRSLSVRLGKDDGYTDRLNSDARLHLRRLSYAACCRSRAQLLPSSRPSPSHLSQRST